MKIERTLFKISISETIILLIFTLFILNAFIFLFYLVTGNPTQIFNDKSLSLQITFPIVYSLMQTAINRDGALKVSGFSNLTMITKQIETHIIKKGYVVTDLGTGNFKYSKTTKLARFFNYFIREDIMVTVSTHEANIFAKRNLLDSIRMKLKYNNTTE